MRIVVTGATGNVGRPLVETLVAAGEKVTAVSRRPSELVGAEQRLADLTEPESLRPALDGADALFLLVADPRVNAERVLSSVREAGVGRVVLVSSQATVTRPDFASHEHFREFEAELRRSGPEWTVLRPGGFASNTLAWSAQVRSERTVLAPFGDVALPVIDPADIAAAAATVLLGTGHAGQAYTLTGPALITPRQQADAIGTALGEPVRFVEQSREQARETLARFMPEPILTGTLAILGQPTEDERTVSPDAQRLLGRAPAPYAAWAERNVAAFR
jgi:uncharacterized protein YbjT (DUF2867 family)